MDKNFTHLIWLGAGSVSEPENVLSAAEFATLVDARESACKLLQKNTSDNVMVKKVLLSTDGSMYEFNELNLPEFSAIQKPTGLVGLFPGIKIVNTEQIQSISISAFIQDLNLSDNNNLLIIDIPDSNLAFLQNLLEKGLLNRFNEIRVQTSSIPLYSNSATIEQVTEFLTLHGFITYQGTHEDPDLPWLTFRINPLWLPLQLALDAKLAHEQECRNIKQTLTTQNTEYTQVLALKNQEITQFQIDLEKYCTTLSSVEKEINHLQLANEKLHDELKQLRKLAASRLETISQLEQKNNVLHKNNEKLEIQQKAINSELLKAESQIDLLKNLFLAE
jgi:hypothetical protein